MKIKVVDLLIKYANERVGKNKVRYNKATDVWDENDFLYDVYVEFGNRNNEKIIEFLNDEVEIIEENKEIKKLNTSIINANRYDYDKNKKMTISNITADILAMSRTINELIDEINNLKEK